MAANDSASSGVVTTSAIGKPFPIGLPKVTMSGTTPRKMHSYDLAYSSMQAGTGLNLTCLHWAKIRCCAALQYTELQSYQDRLQITSLLQQDSSI